MSKNEPGTGLEKHRDWTAPKSEGPSTKRGLFSKARDLGDRVKNSAHDAASAGAKRIKEVNLQDQLANVRDQIKTGAEKVMYKAAEIKERSKEAVIDVYESERLASLTGIILGVIQSPEATKILKDIPFAGPILKIGEAGIGKTLQGQELSVWNRMKHGTSGAKDLAVDISGGEVIKMAKIGLALIDAGPDVLIRVGNILKEKQIKGADTLIVLAEFMQKHPGIINFFKKRAGIK